MKETNSMKKAVDFRLNSDSWDLKIASSVLARKSAKKEKFLLSGSFASIAAATLAVIIFALNLYITDISETGSYSYTLSLEEYTIENDTVASEISGLINEAYPMR